MFTFWTIARWDLPGEGTDRLKVITSRERTAESVLKHFKVFTLPQTWVVKKSTARKVGQQQGGKEVRFDGKNSTVAAAFSTSAVGPC